MHDGNTHEIFKRVVVQQLILAIRRGLNANSALEVALGGRR
jgi:hypothetical protein